MPVLYNWALVDVNEYEQLQISANKAVRFNEYEAH